jgi:hypothetical protein
VLVTSACAAYSKWLNINDINRFYGDFDPNNPVRLMVTFAVCGTFYFLAQLLET